MCCPDSRNSEDRRSSHSPPERGRTWRQSNRSRWAMDSHRTAASGWNGQNHRLRDWIDRSKSRGIRSVAIASRSDPSFSSWRRRRRSGQPRSAPRRQRRSAHAARSAPRAHGCNDRNAPHPWWSLFPSRNVVSVCFCMKKHAISRRPYHVRRRERRFRRARRMSSPRAGSCICG